MYCSTNDKLWISVAAIAQDEGLELYDLERLGGKGLRVFVWRGKDDSGAVKGITSEDCSRVVRRLMVFFQVEGPELGVGAEPQIEVSSPGINRHLRLEEHMKSACGERVRLVCGGEMQQSSLAGRTLIGNLVKWENNNICIFDEQSKTELFVPLNEIRRASVEFKF